MKKQIQTQSANWQTKIKNKLFSTRKMKVVSAIVFLAVSGTVFFSVNYFAKGATYGWLQATWSGGADTGAVANHTSNQSGWTKFFSKDTNVVAGDTLTLSAGTSNVTDTTTAQFGAGTWSTDTNGASCINSNTTGDQMTGTSACYDATGICGNFQVLGTDRVGTTAWATAMSYCDSLCPTCDLPTSTELACMCTNKASFGNNFVANLYWSATEANSAYAYYVNFSNCTTDNYSKTIAYYVRCVRR